MRRAFTLVELLVVIAVLGLLMALLLPAVLAAREAARMANCRSSLHQIGVAIEQELQQSRFIPGVYYDGGTEFVERMQVRLLRCPTYDSIVPGAYVTYREQDTGRTREEVMDDLDRASVDIPVVMDLLPCHGDTRQGVFLDWHVGTVAESDVH